MIDVVCCFVCSLFFFFFLLHTGTVAMILAATQPLSKPSCTDRQVLLLLLMLCFWQAHLVCFQCSSVLFLSFSLLLNNVDVAVATIY